MMDSCGRAGRIDVGLVAAMAVVILAGTTIAAAGVAAPIPLHPLIGDTLDREEAARWGLFPDLPDLDHATFHIVPTGGFVARLYLAGPDGPSRRERHVPRTVWDAWRDRLDAGESAGGVGVPPTPGARAVWPETPLPVGLAAPPPLPASPDTIIPLSAANWITLVDVGYKHSTPSFGDYFTDMLHLGVAVGRPLSDWFVPTLGFTAAIGDMNDDFEAITGNGKTAHYAIELGAQFRAPLGERAGIYLGLAGGYYIRSLRWGGMIYYSDLGIYESGTFVREQSDWGGAARFGLQKRLGSPGTRPRLLDLSVRYEQYRAEASLLVDPETGDTFMAADTDAWVSITLGFIVGI